MVKTLFSVQLPKRLWGSPSSQFSGSWGVSLGQSGRNVRLQLTFSKVNVIDSAAKIKLCHTLSWLFIVLVNRVVKWQDFIVSVMDEDEHGPLAEWRWQRKMEVLGGNLASVRLGSPRRPLRQAELEPAALQCKAESYNFVLLLYNPTHALHVFTL
jgi:hypothetical protein